MRQDISLDKLTGSLGRGVFLPLLDRGARTLGLGYLGFTWARGQLRALWFLKSRPETGLVPGSMVQGLTFIKALHQTSEISSLHRSLHLLQVLICLL